MTSRIDAAADLTPVESNVLAAWRTVRVRRREADEANQVVRQRRQEVAAAEEAAGVAQSLLNKALVALDELGHP